MSNKRRTLLFQEFAKWGWDVKGWSPRTRKKYEYEVIAADKWLVEHRNTSLIFAEPKDLQAYLFSKTPNARTRNYIRQALVGFGHFLVAREYAHVNAALSLPSLPTAKLLPKALDSLQADRIVHASEITGVMENLLIALMLYGGLRKSEVLNLQWKDFDHDYAWVRFIGKGSKERAVPVHRYVQDVLRRWKLACPDPQWLFPSPQLPGRPFSGSKFQHIVKEIGELAGVEGFHAHLLRHTCATVVYERTKGDIRAVQDLLGHSSPQTTAIYTKIRPSRLKEAVETLDFGAPKPKPDLKDVKEGTEPA